MILLLAALLPSLTAEIPDAKTATKLPKPGVQYRMNDATATRSPWIDANGWRILRSGGKSKFYYEVPGADSATLAAAEAFAYGADALVHTDAAGTQAFESFLQFLSGLRAATLPALVNFAVVDDGSAAVGEVMNLLSRHNLLFRIVSAPDPAFKVNVKLGSADYPKAEASDPIRLTHRIRSEVGDDNRLFRIYGSEVVIGRLTGDKTRARLQLIDYDKRAVNGLHVRVVGTYKRYELAVSGAPDAKLEDFTAQDGVTEFSLPVLTRFALIDLFGN